MQMKKTGLKIIILVLTAVMTLSFSGCLKNVDVSRLVEDPTEFEAPEIEEAEEKIFPGEVDFAYQGAYMDVTPVFGERIRIKGMESVIQLLFEAYNNPDRVVNEEPSKRGYKNLIKIYNRQDQLLGTFEMSSDFLHYARADKNSPLFLVPEYAYYTIEYALWQAGASLVPQLEIWDKNEEQKDENITYKLEPLELRLEHDVKTVLVQKYGYSEAYFLDYLIYTTAEYSSDDLLTVRVYALMGYAGYSMMEEEKPADEEATATPEEPEATETAEGEESVLPEDILFGWDYHVETAVRLIYTFVDAKYFRLTDYREPAPYDEELKTSLESRIRAIFPYEYMKKVMEALDDTSDIDQEIRRQALDYLRISGQGNIEIKD